MSNPAAAAGAAFAPLPQQASQHPSQPLRRKRGYESTTTHAHDHTQARGGGGIEGTSVLDGEGDPQREEEGYRSLSPPMHSATAKLAIRDDEEEKGKARVTSPLLARPRYETATEGALRTAVATSTTSTAAKGSPASGSSTNSGSDGSQSDAPMSTDESSPQSKVASIPSHASTTRKAGSSTSLSSAMGPHTSDSNMDESAHAYSDDDGHDIVSPDVEHPEPFYLPTSHAFAARVTQPPHPHQNYPHHPIQTYNSSAAPMPHPHQSMHRSFPMSIRPPMPVAYPPHEEELVPCEVNECYYFIPVREYEQHMLLHHFDIVKRHRAMELAAHEEHERLEQQYGNQAAYHHQPAPAPSPAHTNTVIPCDHIGCGRLIDVDAYAAHQRSHAQHPHAIAPFTVEHGYRQYPPIMTVAPVPAPPITTFPAPAYQPPLHQRPLVHMIPPPMPPPAVWTSRYHSPTAAHRTTGHLGASDTHFVDGIIPILHKIYEQRKDVEVYLCNPMQFFYRSCGDGGFGCGYKNIQTLCSTLLQFDLYRRALFNGALLLDEPATTISPASSSMQLSPATSAPPNVATLGILPSSDGRAPSTVVRAPEVPVPRMPTIASLQSYIDEAHARGYDVVGAAQVGQLRNSKTWIGAVEAHALFCSYGVRSELIDFKSSHVGLMEYVWNYFSERTTMVGQNSQQRVKPSSASNPSHKKGDDALDTHAQEYIGTPGASSPTGSTSKEPPTIGRHQTTFAPPLYFQHQGHSRTIVGIVHSNRNNRFRLLVLDPDMSGGGEKLLHGLTSRDPTIASATLKLLHRSESALRAKEYQMVMIASYGLMTPAEQERSKRPYSTVISALDDDGYEGDGDGDGGASPKDAHSAGSPPPKTPHPQLEQQKHPDAMHERGSGGSGGSGKPGGSGGDEGSVRGGGGEASSGRRWRMEQRELDEKAPARLGASFKKDDDGEPVDRDEEPQEGDEDDDKEEEDEGEGKEDNNDESHKKAAQKVQSNGDDGPANKKKSPDSSSAAKPNKSQSKPPSSSAGPKGEDAKKTKDATAAAASSSKSRRYTTKPNQPWIPPRRLPPASCASSSNWHMHAGPHAHLAHSLDDTVVRTGASSHTRGRSPTRAQTPTPRPASCSRIPATSRLLQMHPKPKPAATDNLKR